MRFPCCIRRISRAWTSFAKRRGSLEPFGGLQLICCGDFFQIPPIARTGSALDPSETVEEKFVLDCAAWRDAGIGHTCYLHEQHRQGDPKLLSILDEIRSGHVGAQSIALLKSRVKAPGTRRASVLPGSIRTTKTWTRSMRPSSKRSKKRRSYTTFCSAARRSSLRNYRKIIALRQS